MGLDYCPEVLAFVDGEDRVNAGAVDKDKLVSDRVYVEVGGCVSEYIGDFVEDDVVFAGVHLCAPFGVVWWIWYSIFSFDDFMLIRGLVLSQSLVTMGVIRGVV